jgi:PAS domain-containing protein
VRLSLVIEEVQAGYWDWDLKNGTVFVSPGWKRQIGFEDSEVFPWGEQKDDRLHPADQAIVTPRLKVLSPAACLSSNWNFACVTRMSRTVGFTVELHCCATQITSPPECGDLI